MDHLFMWNGWKVWYRCDIVQRVVRRECNKENNSLKAYTVIITFITLFSASMQYIKLWASRLQIRKSSECREGV